MDETASFLSTSPITNEEPLERSLRPGSLAEYVGQEEIKRSMSVAIEAAKKRGASVDHLLLYGPPGLGKTSLAYVLAREMETSVRTTSGPVLSKAGDLAAILTSLQEGDILFIDEIHRLPRSVEEILYPAMEDGCLDLMLGKGPSARSLRLDLPRFTLVGATTRAGSLSHPLRDRFGLIHRLDFYDERDLSIILERSSSLLGLTLTAEARAYLAGRSRKTPRIANRLLRRVRDYAVVDGITAVGLKEAETALAHLGIDPLGLDRTDHLVLDILHRQFGDGPVGLETLAAATGEEPATLEEVVEPYLLRLGFIDRTPRGRVLTDIARRHFGFPLQSATVGS